MAELAGAMARLNPAELEALRADVALLILATAEARAAGRTQA